MIVSVGQDKHPQPEEQEDNWMCSVIQQEQEHDSDSDELTGIRSYWGLMTILIHK